MVSDSDGFRNNFPVVSLTFEYFAAKLCVEQIGDGSKVNPIVEKMLCITCAKKHICCTQHVAALDFVSRCKLHDSCNK